MDTTIELPCRFVSRVYWLADEVEVEVEAASVIDVTASVIMIAVIEIETATEIVIETVIAVETKSTRMKAIATVITIVIEMPTATTIEIGIEIENEVANMIATESETDTATSVTTTETATVIVIIRVGTERTLVEATDIDPTTRGWLIGWLVAHDDAIDLDALAYSPIDARGRREDEYDDRPAAIGLGADALPQHTPAPANVRFAKASTEPMAPEPRVIILKVRLLGC